MTVRPHKSLHDAISDLPLVTRSATVTDVSTMDRDRRKDVRRKLTRRFESRGLADEYRDFLDDPDRWEELQTALVEAGYSPLARYVAAFEERYTRPFPMLVRVQFRTDEPLDYLAGQYVGIRYGGHSRAYSLSSAPGRKRVEICVRRSPRGRLSPRICEDLSEGDRVTLRGPHGDLVLKNPSERDVVFLATGTGVAPFKGMADHVFEQGLDEYEGTNRDVWLFLGAAWEDDLPYAEEFRSLARKQENFRFVPTLSRESLLTKWKGETSYVQDMLCKYVDSKAVTAPLGPHLEQQIQRSPEDETRARIDPTNVEVYACGINAMVHSLTKMVRRLGVPDQYVESEGFG